MKLIVKSLVTGTAAAVLFFVGTGMAHADKGGSKGGPSGGSAKAGPSNAGQQMQAKKVGSGQFNSGMAKSNGQHQFQHQNFKKDFCGTPWNYCNYGYGFNNCWSYPWYRSSCSYPVYDYCYSSPLIYTYQPQVIATTRVIQVVQPAPVVETITTTTTNTSGAIVRPPVNGAGFQQGPGPVPPQ